MWPSYLRTLATPWWFPSWSSKFRRTPGIRVLKSTVDPSRISEAVFLPKGPIRFGPCEHVPCYGRRASRMAALSKQWVMRARNGFMGCLGIISFFDGQHSLTDDGFTLLPVAVRNASTRGLTFGTIPLPSVSQEHPTDASTTHCKQPAYASAHRSSLFPCLLQG